MSAATAHTPSSARPTGNAEIGIPDGKAEIVKGLALILAADHAWDHPVEIDLAAEGFGDLLAPTASSAGPSPISSTTIKRTMKTVRRRMGEGSGDRLLAACGD